MARRPEGFLFLVNASAGDTHTAYLVCSDDSGRVRWIRACGEGRNLAGRGLQVLTGGGCAICGSGAAHLGQPDFYLAAMNAEGEITWQREWGGEGSQGLNAVAQDSAGDLILAGWSQAEGREDADLYLAKSDSRGNIIWTRQLGGPEEERLAAVCLAPKGSIVAAGQLAARDDETVILLLKTDAQGQVLWQRSYRLDDAARVADVCAIRACQEGAGTSGPRSLPSSCRNSRRCGSWSATFMAGRWKLFSM